MLFLVVHSSGSVTTCRRHGMPAEAFYEEHSHKARPDRSRGQIQGIPAKHRGLAPDEEEEEGDSFDAFVVETRLVPVSLSQIPDLLPENVSLACNLLHWSVWHFTRYAYQPRYTASQARATTCHTIWRASSCAHD